jgi:hypothetical protein
MRHLTTPLPEGERILASTGVQRLYPLQKFTAMRPTAVREKWLRKLYLLPWSESFLEKSAPCETGSSALGRESLPVLR